MFPTMVEHKDSGRVSPLRKKTRRSEPPTLYQDFEASRRAAMSVPSLLSTSLSLASSSGVGNSGVCQTPRKKSRLNNRVPCSPPWLNRLPSTRQSSHFRYSLIPEPIGGVNFPPGSISPSAAC